MVEAERLPPGVERHGRKYRIKQSFDRKEDAIKALLGEQQTEPDWHAEGLTASDYRPDGREVVARLREEWRRTHKLEMRRLSQLLAFPGRYATIVLAGDQHLGNPGTDIDRLWEEGEIVANTPGMFIITCGDLLDGFVVQKLLHLRHNTRFGICEEWAAVREYLSMIGPKLVASVEGNHEQWVNALVGIDYFADVLSERCAHTIYDSDDCRLTLRVGQYEQVLRIRHNWPGSSQYSDTHAIEKAAKWSHDFDIGVQGHDHKGGMVRPFNNAGQCGWAVKVGSYKAIDEYQHQRGFPTKGPSTAVALMIDGQRGSITPYHDMEWAAADTRDKQRFRVAVGG